MTSQNIYKPADNFIHMSIKNFIWSIAGLCLGVIINNIVVFLRNKLKIKYLFIDLIFSTQLVNNLNILYECLMKFIKI